MHDHVIVLSFAADVQRSRRALERPLLSDHVRCLPLALAAAALVSKSVCRRGARERRCLRCAQGR